MPTNMRNNRVNLTGIAFISQEDAQRLAQHLVREGDIVYSRRGDVTQKALIRKGEAGYFCGTGCLLVRPGTAIESEFLAYHLSTKSNQEWIMSHAVGAHMANLNTGILAKVPLRVPSQTEQRRVVKVLSTLDAKIDLNNRINAELEALAKAIYEYWFVQFDFPDANGRPYKASGGKMVWSEALKRRIPEAWEAVAIGQACETILGGTPHTANPDYWDNADIPWLSSSETASFPVVGSKQRITAAGIRDSAAKVLPAGTVVVSIVRYIRPSVLGIAAATNQSVAGILENVRFPTSYLYQAVCREVPRWMSLRTGAQQPHINKTVIDETFILKPSKGVIDAYRRIADPLFKRMLVAANESLELIQLRDWLLPLLMNGQVKPSGVE